MNIGCHQTGWTLTAYDIQYSFMFDYYCYDLSIWSCAIYLTMLVISIWLNVHPVMNSYYIKPDAYPRQMKFNYVKSLILVILIFINYLEIQLCMKSIFIIILIYNFDGRDSHVYERTSRWWIVITSNRMDAHSIWQPILIDVWLLLLWFINMKLRYISHDVSDVHLAECASGDK